MIVFLKASADPDSVRAALVSKGLWVVRHDGAPGRFAFAVEPFSGSAARADLVAIEGVEEVCAAASAHPLVDAQPASVAIAGVPFGGAAPPVVMAGPCSVESESQIDAAARRIAAAGARFLRGGAYKPRSSPYQFAGYGERALSWLAAAARAHGLAVVTEALSEASVEAVAGVADLIQIGSRNMQNFALLRAAGQTGKPLLLKRGMAATVEEWLLSGEHCLLAGAPSVVFCERGIRSFDAPTRNLLDLGSVALIAHVHRLPVVVDPSHALGRRDLIPAMSRAALAAGACGLLLETHDAPGHALSDGPQALDAAEFERLVRGLGMALR